jgi:hypothetical protein
MDNKTMNNNSDAGLAIQFEQTNKKQERTRGDENL